jgi:hypothetical protein
MALMVSEELPTEDALSGCRGVIDRMFFLVAEKLQTEDALSGFRVVTNGGCPFWFQRSYRKRMSFLLSEELDGGCLSGFREVIDGECPFKFQRSY